MSLTIIKNARIKKAICFLLVSWCYTTPLFANEFVDSVRSRLDLYVGLSGGYGEVLNSANKTGQSGLFRFGLGSMWNINKKMQAGSELGFQTESQMVLSKKSTLVLGPNALPVFLILKSPTDFLVTLKYNIFEPIYVQAKAGFVYESTMVNGADVTTSNRWLPDIQSGMGIKLSEHCRFAINYQRFFGETPVLANMNPLTGVSKLQGIPTWQAVLLSVELNV